MARKQLWAWRVGGYVQLTEGAPKDVNYWVSWDDHPQVDSSNCLDICFCFGEFVNQTGIHLEERQAVQIKVTQVGDIYDILEDK